MWDVSVVKDKGKESHTEKSVLDLTGLKPETYYFLEHIMKPEHKYQIPGFHTKLLYMFLVSPVCKTEQRV
jgi:hypothetical protein